jgi:hypothetical protein
MQNGNYRHDDRSLRHYGLVERVIGPVPETPFSVSVGVGLRDEGTAHDFGTPDGTRLRAAAGLPPPILAIGLKLSREKFLQVRRRK